MRGGWRSRSSAGVGLEELVAEDERGEVSMRLAKELAGDRGAAGGVSARSCAGRLRGSGVV